jgi:exosortase
VAIALNSGMIEKKVIESLNLNAGGSGSEPGSSSTVPDGPIRRWMAMFRAWISPWHVALLITAGVLAWSYEPNLLSLGHIWSDDPNYTHGYLVIPIALAIFWTRPQFPEISAPSSYSQALAWGVLALMLVARAWLYEEGSQWLETATLIPTVACLVWTYGGRPLLMRSWPAIVFLVFLLPLPQGLNGLISRPLQELATAGSSFLLQLTGLWVISEGNVIILNTAKGVERLEVATVCNGLSMLMSLAAVVIATVTLIPLSVWKRAALLASVLPIALFSNIIRIVATGWCYYLFGGEHSRKLAHDWAGFLMMPLALCLVFLEMALLSWLADDGGEAEDARLFMPVLTARKT